jgi:citrate lyase subunit beta/citryl-CoA lyase
VVEENRKAEAAGRASFAIDGRMIDVPVVERARRLLARVAAIEAREARKVAGVG